MLAQMTIACMCVWPLGSVIKLGHFVNRNINLNVYMCGWKSEFDTMTTLM